MPRKQTSSSSSEDESSQSPQQKYISLRVSKLTPNVTEDHLREIFSHFGAVVSVELTKGSRLSSTARLKYEKKQEADHAITHMNNGYIDGTKICVENQGDFGKEKAVVEKKKSPERPLKRENNEKEKKISRSRQEKDRRYKDRHSRDRRQRNRRRRASSSSSSSAVESSGSSSSSGSSRS